MKKNKRPQMAAARKTTESKASDDTGEISHQQRTARAQAFLKKLAGLERLSLVNRQISSLGMEKLGEVLVALDLDPRGQGDVLKKRLKNHFRNKMFPPEQRDADATPQATINGFKPAAKSKCAFDFICVVDFEATCDNTTEIKPEIIEFPAILIDTRTCQTRFEFQRFCRPKLNPKLTHFCTNLTGITQATVDSAQDFNLCLDEFRSFLAQHHMGTKHSWAIVTDSQFDMGYFMVHQCQISGIPIPEFGKQWINIRKTFGNFYGCKRLSLAEMLNKLGMKFEGRHHSGLDDARNILRVSLSLLADGAKLKLNESVDSEDGPCKKRGGCRSAGRDSQRQTK